MADKVLCAVRGCNKPEYVRGWCTTHYQRWKKTGDPLKGGWPRKTICEHPGCEHRVIARGLCSWHYKTAAFRKTCLVDGCDKKVFATDLCVKHYKRLTRSGDVHSVQRVANGSYKKWLEDHISFAGDECLIWPFWRDKRGYGPSRLMCAMAHGEPPSPDHQSAHSCGKGHEGCVNPKHLRWATRKDNQVEMADHGNSQRGEKHFNAKLTREDVFDIRAMKGRMSQTELALKYGVGPNVISRIHGRKAWGWLK